MLAGHGLGLAHWLALAEVARGGGNYPSSLVVKAAAFTDRDYGVEYSQGRTGRLELSRHMRGCILCRKLIL